ncbi:MAG: hypothetical protein SOW80_12255 [Anaerovoracaceae bacterium]|nr:hypothetical protein [Anaerovoracaceae bacterium]
MKDYKVPHSLSINRITGKEANVIPALAGAVGALAGVAAAGVALEGGKAVGRRMFGDANYLHRQVNSANLRVVTVE